MARMCPYVETYLEAALWAETASKEEALSRGRSASTFSAAAIERAASDVDLFLNAVAAEFWAREPFSREERETMSRLFWLSRNGHGAGFLDSYDFPGREGQRLHRLAKSFGGCDVYEGDDLHLHFS